jgi:hypothetical protein
MDRKLYPEINRETINNVDKERMKSGKKQRERWTENCILK